MERIQKVIAKAGICSRRKAEELIIAGKVKVNGVVITLLGTKVSYNDVIEVDGKIIEKEEKKYYVINKPRGVVCTASDDRGRKTILDILPERIKQERIYPVGRLDYDTKGVLLLTNDGEFMNAMVGPKSGIEKEYLARVKGIMTMTDVKKLTEGVVLNGKKTLPAVVEIVSFDREHGSSLVKIIITEGNYHQVKEMFKSIDHEVKKLTRVRFGNITVNNLKEGEIKVLSIHEVKTLYGLAKQSRNINKHKE
jgi:23S rRNA pseudouridine2605 synthase